VTTTSATRFEYLHLETQRHRRVHGCDAYTFTDGPGLLKWRQPAWSNTFGHC
jgi:hypothetical protein